VVVLLPIPVLLQIALLLHIGSRGLALLLQFVEGVSANAFNVIVLVVESAWAAPAASSSAANTVEMSFMIFSFGSVMSEPAVEACATDPYETRTWG
jgi:hypothetical protein